MGPGVYICEECVNSARSCWTASVFRQAARRCSSKAADSPQIVDYSTITSSATTTQKASPSRLQHFKRINSLLNPVVEIGKSNILLIGPTGVGKTYSRRHRAYPRCAVRNRRRDRAD